MNKAELVTAMVEQSGMTKKDAKIAVEAFVGAVSNELKAGGNVQLVGFGTFETRSRAAKKGRNPKTSEIIDIPAKTVPAFKPGKALKELVK